MIGFIRGILRICAFIVMTAVIVTVHYIVILTTGSLRMTRAWHRCVCWLLGIKISVYGANVLSEKQVLYTSNHLSSCDIYVIGAVRDLVFVSKDDVARWPVFGFLAKLQKTVFIARNRAGIRQAQERMLERMEQGHDLVLFPEGTSSDGQQVLPFKRALIPFDPSIDIQPVAIVLTHIDGQAVTTLAQRDRYAWYGDMGMMGHLWGLFSGRSIHLDLHFLPPLNAADFDDVESLTQAARDAIVQIVEGTSP